MFVWKFKCLFCKYKYKDAKFWCSIKQGKHSSMEKQSLQDSYGQIYSDQIIRESEIQNTYFTSSYVTSTHSCPTFRSILPIFWSSKMRHRWFTTVDLNDHLNVNYFINESLLKFIYSNFVHSELYQLMIWNEIVV